MAALLAAGTTIVGSADFTIAAGSSATLCLVDAAGSDGIPANAEVLIQYKAASLEYFTLGSLTSDKPCQVLSATGTFRVFRSLPVNVGVDKD